MVIYFSYLHYLLIPDILKNGLQVQEWRLRPALLACFGPTIGLFIFGNPHPDMINGLHSRANEIPFQRGLLVRACIGL